MTLIHMRHRWIARWSQGLNLLGPPTLVRLAHVRRRLNGRDELKDQVCDTDDTNDATGNLAQNVVVQEDRTNEDVDWTEGLAHMRLKGE